MRVASIDVGSNTLSILIADGDGERWTAVEEHTKVSRLSDGMDASGALSEAALANCLYCAELFAKRARDIGAEKIFATGTAPFRIASNAKEAIRRFTEAFHVPLDVISGAREAELALLATRHAFPELEDGLVLDIGGASTELTRLADGEGVSFEMGSVRLTERFLKSDPPTPQEREELIALVRREFSRCEKWRNIGLPLVGIAGTVTTIGAIDKEMSVWNADEIQGHRIARADVDALAEELITATVAERTKLPGLVPARADVIGAGALILKEALSFVGATELIVSDRGLRWGRLYAEMIGG